MNHHEIVEWRILDHSEALQSGDEWYSPSFAEWRSMRAFGAQDIGIKYRRKFEPWEFRTLITPETQHLYQHLLDALAAGKEVQYFTDSWRTESNFEFSRPPNRYRVKPQNTF